MCIRLLIFVSLAIFGNFASAQTTCTFGPFGTTNRYACVLRNQNIRSDNDMASINGVHVGNQGDTNVIHLDQNSSVINTFPSLIIDHFVSMSFVKLIGVQMKAFGTKITNCAQLFSVDLETNEIRQIPAGIFQNCRRLSSLYINDNQIDAISDDAFLGLAGLSSLWLARNNIVNVNRKMFSHTPELGFLILPNNQIREFTSDILQDLPDLRWLSLDNNQLTTWTSDILSRNPRLQNLDLQGNQIKTLVSDVFSNLPNLIELSIGGLFTEIPKLTGLQRLERLSIRNTPIKHVSSDSFIDMENLQTLSFSNSRIETFNFTSKNVMPILRALYFQNNSISDLEKSSFEMFAGRSNENGLSTLSFYENQIEKLPYEVFKPIIPTLRTLVASYNGISYINRKIIEEVIEENSDTDMSLSLHGNKCVSDDFLINDKFDINKLKRCYNAGISLQINSILLILAVVASIFKKL